jgi:hypothetical protein
MPESLEKHFCYYCGDDKVRADWVREGGSIGERHYLCHRKRCAKKRTAWLKQAREERAARKAAWATEEGL